MRVRAALDLAPEHPGGAGIGGEQRPPSHLVHAVGTDRPGANDLEMGFEIVHCAAFPDARRFWCRVADTRGILTGIAMLPWWAISCNVRRVLRSRDSLVVVMCTWTRRYSRQVYRRDHRVLPAGSGRALPRFIVRTPLWNSVAWVTLDVPKMAARSDRHRTSF
jgi:hypothetical protein